MSTCNFLNDNIWIQIKISLKFLPQGPINNIPALVQIMGWRQPGDKQLSEPMMVWVLMHICITWPQWVNIEVWIIFQQQFPGRILHINLYFVVQYIFALQLQTSFFTVNIGEDDSLVWSGNKLLPEPQNSVNRGQWINVHSNQTLIKSIFGDSFSLDDNWLGPNVYKWNQYRVSF